VNLTKSKPSWLRRKLPLSGNKSTVMAAIKDRRLNTVCVEAHCPNQLECFSRGTATFLLLGPGCTRRCSFCAIDKLHVQKPDPEEPARIADAVAKMDLNFCVLTMVTRDDLPDGGADHIAQTIGAIRRKCPMIGIEVLISDLGGDWNALHTVLTAKPDVLNHNIETVSRLYPKVRPQADYRRSLELLTRTVASVPTIATKSGMMLGLGEVKEEVIGVMRDLQKVGCSLLTIGQYLAPSGDHHPVVRYAPPEEFAEYEDVALSLGFFGIASAPLVRSSYKAEYLFNTARKRSFLK
jgi:lipoic acid synthetase